MSRIETFIFFLYEIKFSNRNGNFLFDFLVFHYIRITYIKFSLPLMQQFEIAKRRNNSSFYIAVRESDIFQYSNVPHWYRPFRNVFLLLHVGVNGDNVYYISSWRKIKIIKIRNKPNFHFFSIRDISFFHF